MALIRDPARIAPRSTVRAATRRDRLGAVGVEFASIFRRFGTEVTVIEMLPRIVPVEDEEISKELARQFKKRQIDLNVNAKVEKVEKTETGVKVSFIDQNGNLYGTTLEGGSIGYGVVFEVSPPTGGS